MTIEATKDGIKFSCAGDIGNGAVTLRNYQNVEKENLNVDVELTEPVSLTFSLKYLVNFCKAQPLSDRVKICLSNEVPLLVEYLVTGTSYLRFYLAPKVRRLSLVGCAILTENRRLGTRSKECLRRQNIMMTLTKIPEHRETREKGRELCENTRIQWHRHRHWVGNQPCCRLLAEVFRHAADEHRENQLLPGPILACLN